MGGSWEALVKLVKRALKTVVQDRLFTQEALSTFLCEVESMLNTRPITPVSDDPNDLEALTPNHIIMGRANTNSAPGTFDESEIDSRRKWRGVQAATNMFWPRFTNEYIPLLTTRSKWFHDKANICVGDLVLVADDSTSRNKWPLARVKQTYTGKDGVVRTVLLKYGKGELIRPVKRVCVLENVTAE